MKTEVCFCSERIGELIWAFSNLYHMGFRTWARKVWTWIDIVQIFFYSSSLAMYAATTVIVSQFPSISTGLVCFKLNEVKFTKKNCELISVFLIYRQLRIQNSTN